MFDDKMQDLFIKKVCAIQQPNPTDPKPFFSKECISPLRWQEHSHCRKAKQPFQWDPEELAHLQTCLVCKRIKSFMEKDDGKLTELSDDIPANSLAKPHKVIWALAASILGAGTIFAWLFF